MKEGELLEYMLSDGMVLCIKFAGQYDCKLAHLITLTLT